jgi:hypothetical protein
MCDLMIPDDMREETPENEEKWAKEREIYGTQIPTQEEMENFRLMLECPTTYVTDRPGFFNSTLDPHFISTVHARENLVTLASRSDIRKALFAKLATQFPN